MPDIGVTIGSPAASGTAAASTAGACSSLPSFCAASSTSSRVTRPCVPVARQSRRFTSSFCARRRATGVALTALSSARLSALIFVAGTGAAIAPPPARMATSISSTEIRPSGPEPLTRARLIPSFCARRRAREEALMPSGVAPCRAAGTTVAPEAGLVAMLCASAATALAALAGAGAAAGAGQAPPPEQRPPRRRARPQPVPQHRPMWRQRPPLRPRLPRLRR